MRTFLTTLVVAGGLAAFAASAQAAPVSSGPLGASEAPIHQVAMSPMERRMMRRSMERRMMKRRIERRMMKRQIRRDIRRGM